MKGGWLRITFQYQVEDQVYSQETDYFIGISENPIPYLDSVVGGCYRSINRQCNKLDKRDKALRRFI